MQHITLVQTANSPQLLYSSVWWRGGFLAASWLVVKLPGGEMTGKQIFSHFFLAFFNVLKDLPG